MVYDRDVCVCAYAVRACVRAFIFLLFIFMWWLLSLSLLGAWAVAIVYVSVVLLLCYCCCNLLPFFLYIEVYVRGDYMQRLCYLLSYVICLHACVRIVWILPAWIIYHRHSRFCCWLAARRAHICCCCVFFPVSFLLLCAHCTCIFSLSLDCRMHTLF